MQNIKAKITSYQYVQSTPGNIIQGVKNNRIPKGAIRGGNGSFVVKGESPKVNIRVTCSDGSTFIYNIYYIIKKYSTRARLSESYATEICKKLLAVNAEFEFGPNDNIIPSTMYDFIVKTISSTY